MSPAEPETAARHEGGCQSGAIRYRVDGQIDSISHSNCAMCRRSRGALVVTWFTVARGRFALTEGEPARWSSSENAERTFCPSCGAQITFWSTRHPDEIDVTLGSLDHPERHPADRHVWVESKVPWLHLDESLPAHVGFTPSEGAG